jgi:hypothetical protein
MKQLIEDLISAMEYHVEQTRPIHSTTVALQAAREALKSMSAPLACDCKQGQVCGVCDPITPPAAQPAPVPTSWMEMVTANLVREGVNKHKARELAEHFYSLAPAAQPAVPDAIGPNEDELPAYAAGWNDCRAEMLKGMK